MTFLLSSVVATIVLAADPGLQGLPFGVPPAPEDAVIAHVAPPQCLFYVNWAGTASPNAASSSETEKMLAEPELQEFISGLGKVITAFLRQQDEEAKRREEPPKGGTTSAGSPADMRATPLPSPVGTPLSEGPSTGSVPEKPKFNIATQDYGDWLKVLLTHPTAIFFTDFRAKLPKLAEKADNVKQKPVADAAAAQTPQGDATQDMEIRGGMVVSLGPDADRLQAKFLDYLKQAKKTGAAAGLEQIKIAGETWYRVKPGDCVITFGFQGEYFVAGIGQGTVEGILARWNGEAPAWLKRAMEQTVVSRRTGIIYLNLKEIRDKLLPLTPSQKDPLAALKMLGLDNVDSLVSTTGLEDDGMINRVHLSLDGEPRGLLDMISDRPLAAKDLGPIPHDALLAMAARVDLDRALEALIAVGKKAGAAGDADIGKSVEEFKGQYGVDLNRFLGSVGDAWCIYNSPAEGEMAFLGWTAVVPVRDRAALLEGWEKLYAAQKAKETKNKDAQGKKEADAPVAPNTPPDVRKCRFAGHEIYYWAGQPITPAVCITDREMVMTLNMPAMKAYLSRKEHRSLATLPSVKRALNDSNRPVALGYCDTPRLFNFLYPVFSLYAGMGASAAQKLGVDLDPTFWPSAPAIRRHLRPDITTVERTPQGLQLTCRYSLPTGGASGPLWLAGFYYAATIIAMSDPPVRIFPGQPAWPLTPLAPSTPATSPATTPAPDYGTPAGPPPLGASVGDAHRSSSKQAASAAASQIYFVGPEGLTIQWDVAALGRFDSEPLVAPARYNFPQGALYRLKLTDIPGRAGVEHFPTIEVAPAVPRTEAFLAHNAIPVEFTDEDFDQVMTGNFVTKVIYLPDPEFQEMALAGVGTLVSTRLAPGVDPIIEAGRRGAIIAIVRLGKKESGPGDLQKQQKDSLWRNDRIPIFERIQPGLRDVAMESPSEKEVLRALEKARSAQFASASLYKVKRTKVRIVSEVIQDSVDPPRVMPLVGPSQVHHVHYKCIVRFTETAQLDWPTPHTTVDEDCKEVVYIDHDHLHLVNQSGDPKPPASPKK